VQYPLSREEQAAMSRYLSVIRQQLQDVSALFSSRYGKNSNLAEIAARSVACTTLLERELLVSDGNDATMARRSEEAMKTSA
jgi:hypothetical protein